MKSLILTAILTLIGYFGFSQTVTFTITGGSCESMVSMDLLGIKTNGKNHYRGGDYDVFWTGSQWNLTGDVLTTSLFTNSTETAEDPPCFNFGTWMPTGSCSGGTIDGSSDNCNSASLPVKLISFKAHQVGSYAMLKWVTTSEINNEGFEIEHSTDGELWERVGYVNGNGTTNQRKEYQYAHRIVDEKAYYRLRQVDYDGQFEHSNIISPVVDRSADHLSIYPNPASDRLVLSVREGEMKVFDITGQIVFTHQIEMEHETIDISSLNPGRYIVRVNSPLFYENLHENLIVR